MNLTEMTGVTAGQPYRQDNSNITFVDRKSTKKTEYIINIPSDVEYKIRILCAMSPDLEWSGILFYNISGSFDSGITVTCKDIFVMDSGSYGETEFDWASPDIAAYVAENPGCMECYQGLIHSHHNMKAFFSGQDIHTLGQIGSKAPVFVSLIVNNAGKYAAAVTRRVKTVTTGIMEVQESTFADDIGGKIDKNVKTVRKPVDNTSINVLWYTLKVSVESVQADPCIERFLELQHRNSFQNNSRIYNGGRSIKVYDDWENDWDESWKDLYDAETSGGTVRKAGKLEGQKKITVKDNMERKYNGRN